jgi:hypothetical protein
LAGKDGQNRFRRINFQNMTIVTVAIKCLTFDLSNIHLFIQTIAMISHGDLGEITRNSLSHLFYLISQMRVGQRDPCLAHKVSRVIPSQLFSRDIRPVSNHSVGCALVTSPHLRRNPQRRAAKSQNRASAGEWRKTGSTSDSAI